MLKVFVNYFPKHESTKQVHRFLKNLRAWVKDRTEQVGFIYPDALTLAMEEIATKTGYNITKETYIGCRGYRGPTNDYSSAAYFYTSSYYCSMWTLWTLLTVQRYHQFPNAPLTANNKVVLDAMMGWGQDYFQCRGCQSHFMKMVNNETDGDNFGSPAIALLKDIKKPKEAPLWLWDAHNMANCRQQDWSTADPMFPKHAWPLKEYCPTCYKGSDEGVFEPPCKPDKVEKYFNSEEVLKFLVKMYNDELDYSQEATPFP